MSELTPKELAAAAAQGVAIALNARGAKPGAKEEKFVLPHRIICGIPQHLYEVGFTPSPGGGVSPTEPKQQG